MSEKIVQLNGEVIKGELRELVRGSVEEALNEMYLAGVSARRLEDIAEVLWGSKAAPSTISERNKKAYIHIWGLISETRANLGKRSPCTLRCHRGRLRAGGCKRSSTDWQQPTVRTGLRDRCSLLGPPVRQSPNVLVSAMQGSLDSYEDRMAALLFKMAVELSMVLHVTAAANTVRHGDASGDCR